MSPIPSPLLFDWIALVSVFAFAAMGVDKMFAVGRLRRVSEKTFWLISLLGGFLGIFIGGLVFHHKTSKSWFWVPVVISAAIWLAALALSSPQTEHLGV